MRPISTSWRSIGSRGGSGSSARTIAPVGLFGVQTKITRVRSVTAAAIASRSWRSSMVSGTGTGVAPAIFIGVMYLGIGAALLLAGVLFVLRYRATFAPAG